MSTVPVGEICTQSTGNGSRPQQRTILKSRQVDYLFLFSPYLGPNMFNAPFPLRGISAPKPVAVWIIYPNSHGHEPLACYLFGVILSLYHVQFGLFYRFNPYVANLKLQQPCNFNKSIMQMSKNTEKFVNPFNSICTCLFKSRHGRDSTDP